MNTEMEFLEPEKRVCKECYLEAYAILEFSLKQYPNLCKKCVGKKQKLAREKRYGKREGFKWGRDPIVPRKST